MVNALSAGLLLWLLASAAQAAPLELQKAFIVHFTSTSAIAETGTAEMILGEPRSFGLILQAMQSGQTRFFGPVRRLRYGGRIVNVEPYAGPAGLKIRWFKVEPEMYHVDGRGHDPANPNFLWYANAGAPGGRTDRQPLAPDTIRYVQNAWAKGDDAWKIFADAHPTDPNYDVNDGLGTMTFAATLQSDLGVSLETPTLKTYKTSDRLPLLLARVIVRENHSYTGYLTGYFNVPGVFGSYEAQVLQHIGVDCADLVVGARREFARKTIPFTNVTGLRTRFQSRYLTLVAGDVWLSSNGRIYRHYDARRGVLTNEAKIEAQIGDVIVFNYSTDAKRPQWDHVGVLYQRATTSKILSGHDRLIHAGPAEAHVDRLAGEKFVVPSQPTRIAVLRWRS